MMKRDMALELIFLNTMARRKYFTENSSDIKKGYTTLPYNVKKKKG
jgi:hypothetical protein